MHYAGSTCGLMAHVRRVLGNELLKIVIEMEVSWRNGGKVGSGGKRGNGGNDGKQGN